MLPVTGTFSARFSPCKRTANDVFCLPRADMYPGHRRIPGAGYMLNSPLRSLLLHAVDRKPGVPPTIFQRLIVAVMVILVSAVLPFVYGIFIGVVLFLFDVELVGRAPQTAVATVLIGAVIGLLKGLRNAIDYWRNYDLPD